MQANTPKYAAPDGSAIDLNINHPEHGWIPFTARADDPLGSDLYAQAINGDFGPIEAYDGPTVEDLLEIDMRAQRNALLHQLDAIVMNPLRWAQYTVEQQAAFATYRQALLDVPQQNGFPHSIEWPQMIWQNDESSAPPKSEVPEPQEYKT